MSSCSSETLELTRRPRGTALAPQRETAYGRPYVRPRDHVTFFLPSVKLGTLLDWYIVQVGVKSNSVITHLELMITSAYSRTAIIVN